VALIKKQAPQHTTAAEARSGMERRKKARSSRNHFALFFA
jgi:hypothetical protein